MAQRTVQLERCLLVAMVAVFLTTVIGCNQYRVAPLQRNVPVGLIDPVSPAQQERAIEVGLAKRHWVVVEKVPGRYVAKLSERVHQVTIAVSYDAKGIFIDYIDSSQLQYERDGAGHEIIHRKYNTWVKNLTDEIRILLVQARTS